jgi:hypothetical protein
MAAGRHSMLGHSIITSFIANNKNNNVEIEETLDDMKQTYKYGARNEVKMTKELALLLIAENEKLLREVDGRVHPDFKISAEERIKRVHSRLKAPVIEKIKETFHYIELNKAAEKASMEKKYAMKLTSSSKLHSYPSTLG